MRSIKKVFWAGGLLPPTYVVPGYTPFLLGVDFLRNTVLDFKSEKMYYYGVLGMQEFAMRFDGSLYRLAEGGIFNPASEEAIYYSF